MPRGCSQDDFEAMRYQVGVHNLKKFPIFSDRQPRRPLASNSIDFSKKTWREAPIDDQHHQAFSKQRQMNAKRLSEHELQNIIDYYNIPAEETAQNRRDLKRQQQIEKDKTLNRDPHYALGH